MSREEESVAGFAGGGSSLDPVRAVAMRVAEGFRAAGLIDEASVVSRALGFSGHDHEMLLELRSALITTRPAWAGAISKQLQDEAAATLAAAKRLAIEM